MSTTISQSPNQVFDTTKRGTHTVTLSQSMHLDDGYQNGCDRSPSVDQTFDLNVYNSADLFDRMPIPFFQGHDDKSSFGKKSKASDIYEKALSDLEPKPMGEKITIVPTIPLGIEGISTLYESGLYDVLCHDSLSAGMQHNKKEENASNNQLAKPYFFPVHVVQQGQDCSTSKGIRQYHQNKKVLRNLHIGQDSPKSVDAQSHDSEMTKQERALKRYQDKQWQKRFQQLLEFYRIHGHCVVPRYYHQPLYDDNDDDIDDDGDDNSRHEDTGLSRRKRKERSSGLSHWVKRQRYQYKLKCQGLPSRLSDDRQAKLEALGFCWNAHTSAWDTKFASLLRFFQMHGHADVPSCYAQDQSLSTWVKGQRRQMHLWKKTGKSTLTLKRKEALDALGFNWNPRNL